MSSGSPTPSTAKTMWNPSDVPIVALARVVLSTYRRRDMDSLCNVREIQNARARKSACLRACGLLQLWPLQSTGAMKTSAGRCPWADSSPAMRQYHDDEWGVPSHDDRYLFELLILEGAQAGLSWATILNRRAGYKRAFASFDVDKVAKFGDRKLERLLDDEGIIRNRLKIFGTRTNAQAFLRVRAEFGSFATYLWSWVGGAPIVNRPKTLADLSATTELSDRISKDLKRRGFTFVGSTIVYSLVQSAGLVDDHLISCPAKRRNAVGS
jgi:DNA-3-methyladenine glycosylase I